VKQQKIKPALLFLCLAYIGFLGGFYYIYVPLVRSFQLIMVPILLLTFLLTLYRPEQGVLWFVFAFPLVNFLPYFFRIYGDVPHAPTALLLFLFLLLGWLLNRSYSYSTLDVSPLSRVVFLAIIVISISGVITFWRYTNFAPLLSDRIHELVVNRVNVRAGGAMMSVLFNLLSYLTGFMFLFVLWSVVRSKKSINKILAVLLVSTFLSLVVALIQKYHSLAWGNQPFWVTKHQINATFKDPNAFGAYISGMFGVLLGMSLFLRKKLKLVPIFIMLGMLFVFPSVGSRSAFLALAVSSIAFTFIILTDGKISLKKKAIYASALALAGIVFVSFLLLFSKGSNLSMRLGDNLASTLNADDIRELISGRTALWGSAAQMIEDFPLTGVGIGGFIIELPNYGKPLGLSLPSTDSAENYFLQIASEIGLVGIFLFFWVFWEIFKETRIKWRGCDRDDRDRFLFIGLVCGMIALMTNFLFHSYVGSFETQYLFWLYVGIIFVWPANESPLPKKRPVPARKFGIAILVAVFASVHLWNSTHPLSINSEAAKYGWDQNFGLYGTERDNRGFVFQWARREAGLTIANLGPVLVIPMLATHPDIQENPVRVRVYLGNSYFRKRALIGDVTFREKTWQDLEYHLSNSHEKKLYLVLETDRSWEPARYSGVHDARSLAVALGEIWYKYPGSLPAGKYAEAEKTLFNHWEGKLGKNLVGTGTSRIRFQVSREGSVLRLRAKGQKALGVGPYLVIGLDDVVIGKTMLTTDDWESLVLPPKMKPGEHVLSVEFTNDFHEPGIGQDRNVFLGDLEVVPRARFEKN
jgi:O-antigen ligase